MNKTIRWILAFGWALLIWSLTTIPDFKVTNDTTLSILISNGGHLIFFGILALLIPLLPLHSLATTSLYGLAIELVQRGIPGRSFSLADWALDTVGAIILLTVTQRFSTVKLDEKKTR